MLELQDVVIIIGVLILLLLLSFFWSIFHVFAYKTARELYPDRNIIHNDKPWLTVNLWHSQHCSNKSILSDCTKA